MNQLLAMGVRAEQQALAKWGLFGFDGFTLNKFGQDCSHAIRSHARQSVG